MWIYKFIYYYYLQVMCYYYSMQSTKIYYFSKNKIYNEILHSEWWTI